MRLRESSIRTNTGRSAAMEQRDIYAALRDEQVPYEVRILLDTLSAILKPAPTEQIRSPADAAAVLLVEMGHLDQEEMRAILLDTKNRIRGVSTIYKGSLDTATIRIGELYKPAIRQNCASIILAHNHPSGSIDPSPEDVLVTRKAVEAGELLKIQCLDQLIIGQGRWVSLKERGLGFK